MVHGLKSKESILDESAKYSTKKEVSVFKKNESVLKSRFTAKIIRMM